MLPARVPPSSGARIGWCVLAVLVAVATATGLLVASGGDPGALAVARVLVRVVLELAVAAVLGVLAGLRLVLPADHPRRDRMLDVAAAAAALWTVAAATTAFLRYLGTAPAVSAPQFGPGLVAFLEDPGLGGTWLAAAVGAALLTTALVAVRSRRGVALLGPGALLALVPVALQSIAPGASTAAARTAFSTELVLLAGTGAWIGLVALATLERLSPVQLRRAAVCAGVCGAVVAAVALLGAPEAVEGGVPVPATAARTGVLVIAAVLIGAAAARRRPRALLLRAGLLVLAGSAGFTSVVAAGRRLEVSRAVRTTPAEILSGAPLPPPITPLRLLTAVQPDPLWLLVVALLLGGSVAAVVVLHRGGSRWPVGRAAAWVVGLVLLGWLTSGGPAVYQEVLLSVHLARLTALLLVVPLLLVLGAPTGLLAPVGGRDLRLTGILTRPVPAAAAAVVVGAALVGTGLLRWSLTDPVGAAASTAVALAVGVVLVRALLTARGRIAVVVPVALLVIEAAGAVTLATGAGLLLVDWYGAMGWGTDARIDQRTGALVAGAVLVLATVVLLVSALRRLRGEDVLLDERPGAVGRPQEEVPA